MLFYQISPNNLQIWTRDATHHELLADASEITKPLIWSIINLIYGQ